jgi:hypothetical protein
LKFRASCQVWDIAKGVEHSEGGARILDDLMGEEAWEGDVVRTACRFWLAGAREPLEKKD